MRFPISVLLDNNSDKYLAQAPDIPGCKIEADNFEQALRRIESAMEEHLTLLSEYGESIPRPNPIENYLNNESFRYSIWAVIDIDLTPYLGKSHKINVTLPELLIKRIDDRVAKDPVHKSRSGFIAAACLNELNNQ